MSRARSRPNPTAEAHWEGGELLRQHPVFSRLSGHVAWVYDDRSACPGDGWSVVFRDDLVHLHPKRLALPEEWVYVRAPRSAAVRHGAVETRPRRLGCVERGL